MGHRLLTFGKDPVFFSSGSRNTKENPLVNRIRIVGLATLVAGLILAGASTATFAQDEVVGDEYTVISEAWYEFLGENWATLSDAEAAAYEAEFLGLMEDSTISTCRAAAGAMSVVPGLVGSSGSEAEWYAGQYVRQSVESGLFNCYFSQ